MESEFAIDSGTEIAATVSGSPKPGYRLLP